MAKTRAQQAPAGGDAAAASSRAQPDQKQRRGLLQPGSSGGAGSAAGAQQAAAGKGSKNPEGALSEDTARARDLKVIVKKYGAQVWDKDVGDLVRRLKLAQPDGVNRKTLRRVGYWVIGDQLILLYVSKGKMESLATLLGPTATQSAVRCFAGATSAGLLTHKQLEKKEEQRRHPKPKNGVPVSPPTPEELEQQLQELHEGQVKAQELHRDLALLRQVVIPDLGSIGKMAAKELRDEGANLWCDSERPAAVEILEDFLLTVDEPLLARDTIAWSRGFDTLQQAKDGIAALAAAVAEAAVPTAGGPPAAAGPSSIGAPGPKSTATARAAAGACSSKHDGSFEVQRPLAAAAVGAAGRTAAAAAAAAATAAAGSRGGGSRTASSTAAAAAAGHRELGGHPVLSAIGEEAEGWEGSCSPAAAAATVADPSALPPAAAAAAIPVVADASEDGDELLTTSAGAELAASIGSGPSAGGAEAGPPRRGRSRAQAMKQQQQEPKGQASRIPVQQKPAKKPPRPVNNKKKHKGRVKQAAEGQQAQQQQQQEQERPGKKSPRARDPLSTANLAYWVTLTNAWPAIQELFEDQYVRLEGAHKGMAPKALSQLWAAQVQEVCQLLLAARDSIDLDIGGEGGPPAELLKFCEQQCFMHKSLEQMQAKAAKRVKQQKGKGGTAAAGGSSSDKEEGVPAALREVDGKMENLARLLFKMSELVYIEEDEMTFKRFTGGKDNLTGQARVMDFTERNGKSIELVAKSMPVLMVAPDGGDLDDAAKARLPKAARAMRGFGFIEVASEFLVCNLVRDFRVLGAYGGSWKRIPIKVAGGNAIGAYVYCLELLLPNRGMDLQQWKEELFKCPKFQMLTRPTQRMVLSNTAWSVAEQVGQLLAWLQAEGAVHYDCKLPNLALLGCEAHHLLLRMGRGIISLLDAGSVMLERPITLPRGGGPVMRHTSVKRMGTMFMLAPMQVDPKLLRDPQKDLPKPQPTSVVAKVDSWLLGFTLLIMLIVELKENQGGKQKQAKGKGLVSSQAPQQAQGPAPLLTSQELKERITTELQRPGAAAAAALSQNLWLHPSEVTWLKHLVVDVKDNDTRTKVAARSKELLDLILDRCTEDVELRQFIRDAMHPDETQRPSCQQLAERAALICSQRGIHDLLQAAGEALQAA